MTDIEVAYWGLLGHLMERNAKLYHRKHTKVRIRPNGDGSDYPSFLKERFISGSPPDLFQTFNEPNAYYLWKGWAGVLEDYIPEAAKYKKEISNKQYLKSLLTPDGRLQGMIYYGAHAAFLYNKTHLQTAGFADPPTEWDEVISQAKKVKEKDIAKSPIILGIAGPGYLEALYSIMVGMNAPQRSYLFDEDLNPIFDDTKSPLFVTLRWVIDAANRHKVLARESIQHGAFDATYAMGQLRHTFSWLPRYVLPVIDFMSMSRRVSQALNPGYGYTSCYIRVYSPSKKALQSEPMRLEEVWKVMQYLGGRTNDELEPDLRRGKYRVLKSQVLECGVPSPADALWRDRDVSEAMGKWGPLDVLKEQDKKVYNAQCDPWPAPWLLEWVNEWGKAPFKNLVHSVIEKDANNRELLSGLRRIAGDWNRLKKKYNKA